MKLFKMTLAFLALASTAHAAPPVFERVRASIYIYKRTIERVGDEFKWKEEAVCRKTIDLDVPDLRNSNIQASPLHRTDCATTLDGLPMTLSLFSDVAVDRVQLQGRQDSTDLKTYYSSLAAYSQTPPQKEPEIPSATPSYTKDLGVKSMIHNLTPNQGIICLEQSGPIETTPMSLQNPGLLPKNNVPNNPDPENCQAFNPVGFGAVVEFETL